MPPSATTTAAEAYHRHRQSSPNQIVRARPQFQQPYPSVRRRIAPHNCRRLIRAPIIRHNDTHIHRACVRCRVHVCRRRHAVESACQCRRRVIRCDNNPYAVAFLRLLHPAKLPLFCVSRKFRLVIRAIRPRCHSSKHPFFFHIIGKILHKVARAESMQHIV
mgnify:CR=1 FL=1